MSRDGFIRVQGDENKLSRISQLNTADSKALEKENRFGNQQHHEEQEYHDLIDDTKDIDSDSGISSVRHSRGKVATSFSGTNITTDDDDDDDRITKEALLSIATLSDKEDDNQSRRASNASSITNFTISKISNEFYQSSLTSSRSSRINTSGPSLSMVAVSSQQSLAAPLVDTNIIGTKPKSDIRSFLRNIFRSSARSQGNTISTLDDPSKNPQLNIDLVSGTAYPPMRPLPITQGPIRLLLLRHGERLDRYYSSQWLRQAFDKDGNYCRFSPILPETLPFRASVRDFDLDPPLTYKGLKDAYQTGTILKEKSIHIHYCYSSPALRCVQTATKILEGLQLHNKVKIRIEPGLFECTGWYTASESSNVFTMPKFLTKKEFLENKFPINKNYHEQMNQTEISQLETELEFYQRSHAVAGTILKMHEHEFISNIQQGHASPLHHVHILFIAHAPTLETCTRKLCGGKFRPDKLSYIIRNVDFLTMTVIEKTDNNRDKWIFRRNSFYGDEF